MASAQLLISLLMCTTTMAFPKETGAPDPVQAAAQVTGAAAPGTTAEARLRCTDGSTILRTTDCTMGTPISFCHKKEPPIKCQEGFFPSVWHPDHCMEESTCFPLDAVWITTECSNGGIPYTTKTLFDGTLEGGESTVISAVSCSCAADQWYSMSLRDDSSLDTYCMPHGSCPPGMTTSVSTNEYCATAAPDACRDIPLETPYCQCADPTETPIYPEFPGAAAIGCEE